MPARALTAPRPTAPRIAAGGRGRTPTARAPWLLIIPALLVYGAVFLLPTIVGAGYAFTDWDGLQDPSWVGLGNFTAIFEDPTGRDALVHSLELAALYVVAVNVVGLGLAVGLHRTLKSRHALRAIFFLPAALSPLAVSYVWQFVLQPHGPVNSGLESIGLGSVAQPWLGEPTTALLSLVVVMTWQFCGYHMAIYVAGLESIPSELYEAAAVDGAGVWRQFVDITLPQLRPALIISVALSLIGILKIFDQVIALTGGGPGDATETLATQVYRQAFVNSRFGYSAALALLLTIAIAVFSVLQMRGMRERRASA